MFELYKDDMKGIFKIGFLLVLLFIIIKIPILIRKISLKNYTCEEIGKIDEITFVKGIQESQIGGKLVTTNYLVKYRYKIDNKKLENTENVSSNSLSLKDKLKLERLEKDNQIIIIYNCENPQQSKIKFNEK